LSGGQLLGQLFRPNTHYEPHAIYQRVGSQVAGTPFP